MFQNTQTNSYTFAKKIRIKIHKQIQNTFAKNMFQNTQTNTKYFCKENTYQNTPANKNLKNFSKSTMCRAHKQNTGYFCKDQSQRSKHKMSKTHTKLHIYQNAKNDKISRHNTKL